MLRPLPGGLMLSIKGGQLLLEGVMEVVLVRILELRKTVGRSNCLRLSVRASDAPACAAVVLPVH